jgi:hypothetical protein
MQKKFLASPETYASVDLAAAGNCVVCRKMVGKDVPGKAEFTSVYKGCGISSPRRRSGPSLMPTRPRSSANDFRKIHPTGSGT